MLHAINAIHLRCFCFALDFGRLMGVRSYGSGVAGKRTSPKNGRRSVYRLGQLTHLRPRLAESVPL